MGRARYLPVGRCPRVEVHVSRAVPRSRRPLTVLAGAALLAPLALTGTPPAAAADRYSVTALEFTVRAGDRSCTVDADLYRPAGVDAGHPAPAVLATNGFGGSKSDGSTDVIGRAFAERGYVGLVYSGLGFGKSGCLITLDDPAIDGEAASALVDFLAGTRAADDGTEADFVSSGTPGAFKWQWTNGFYLMGAGQPLLVPGLDPSRFGTLGCLHFAPRACDTIRLLNSGRYPAAATQEMLTYARSVSPASYLSGVTAPTLLVQGQADSLFNLNEATATYRALKSQGTTTKMIWQAWGHSGGQAPGELDLSTGDLESSYVGRRILDWFGRYLRHDENTATGPEFAYYRDWESGYGTAASVPATSRTMYLSGDGSLVDSRTEVAPGSRRYTNRLLPTSHSESSLAGLIGLSDPAPYDTKGTYLGWTSAPLDEPVDVVGAPKATLKVVSPQTERVQN